jgi:hypothetical protein
MNIKNTDKLYIYQRDECKCYYCHKPLKYNKITLDHYLPKSHEGTTDVFNLVTCCKFCNEQKGNRIPEDYNEVILNLFLKAVEDNRIIKASLKVPQSELNEEMIKANKVENISDHFTFQSNSMRFDIKNNKVFKVIHIKKGF